MLGRELKIERIFAKIFARNYEKNNTWNIRRLVNETIVHNDLKVRLEILYFHFCKVIKKIERIFAKNFPRNYEKK